MSASLKMSESIGRASPTLGHVTCRLLRTVDIHMTLQQRCAQSIVQSARGCWGISVVIAAPAPRAARAAVPQRSDRETFWTPPHCADANNNHVRVLTRALPQDSTTCTPI